MTRKQESKLQVVVRAGRQGRLVLTADTMRQTVTIDGKATLGEVEMRRLLTSLAWLQQSLIPPDGNAAA
jgi:hypothetical protein